MKVKVIKIKCKRCNHVWVSRKPEVRKCPKCQSPWFDVAREPREIEPYETEKNNGLEYVGFL